MVQVSGFPLLFALRGRRLLILLRTAEVFSSSSSSYRTSDLPLKTGWKVLSVVFNRYFCFSQVHYNVIISLLSVNSLFKDAVRSEYTASKGERINEW